MVGDWAGARHGRGQEPRHEDGVRALRRHVRDPGIGRGLRHRRRLRAGRDRRPAERRRGRGDRSEASHPTRLGAKSGGLRVTEPHFGGRMAEGRSRLRRSRCTQPPEGTGGLDGHFHVYIFDVFNRRSSRGKSFDTVERAVSFQRHEQERIYTEQEADPELFDLPFISADPDLLAPDRAGRRIPRTACITDLQAELRAPRARHALSNGPAAPRMLLVTADEMRRLDRATIECGHATGDRADGARRARRGGGDRAPLRLAARPARAGAVRRPATTAATASSRRATWRAARRRTCASACSATAIAIRATRRAHLERLEQAGVCARALADDDADPSA